MARLVNLTALPLEDFYKSAETETKGDVLQEKCQARGPEICAMICCAIFGKNALDCLSVREVYSCKNKSGDNGNDHDRTRGLPVFDTRRVGLLAT